MTTQIVVLDFDAFKRMNEDTGKEEKYGRRTIPEIREMVEKAIGKDIYTVYRTSVSANPGVHVWIPIDVELRDIDEFMHAYHYVGKLIGGYDTGCVKHNAD